jgi:predicted nucleic acid-binding protein
VTADKVVDASAIAAVIFNEPRGADVAILLKSAKLHAPPLIDVEMASICLKKIRTAAYPRDVVLKMYAAYFRVVILKSEIEPLETIALAERHSLSSYDASYLWLSRHLQAELITLDKDLNTAAKAI